MYKVEQNETTVKAVFSSDMKFIDRVVSDLASFWGKAGEKSLSEVNTVIRELAANAIEHGNKWDIVKLVTFEVEKTSDLTFQICITDEGDGFDLSTIDMSVLKDPQTNRSRGIPLSSAYADDLRYEDEGRKALVLITLTPEAGIDVNIDGDWSVVVLSGNLTASSVNEFKKKLVDVLKTGTHRIRLDLTNVSEIDSLGLSSLVVLSKMIGKNSDESGLEIIHANSSLMNLFRLTRIDRIYTIK